jgi:hypothetical protein
MTSVTKDEANLGSYLCDMLSGLQGSFRDKVNGEW